MLKNKSRTGQQALPLVQPSERPHSFDRYIFICGLHRSGTTLIEQQMRAHFDLSCLEGPVPENEGQHLQDIYPIAQQYGGPGKFAFAPEMRPDLPGPDEAGSCRRRLLQCWTPWLTQRGETFLEKSPPNLIKIAFLRAVFPDARFVIFTRHPLAVSAATRKWSKTSIEELVLHWHTAHHFALQDEKDDCLRMRYEDFCEDPDGELNRLATFLDLEPRAILGKRDARFSKVKNSNSKYFAGLPARNFGAGSWDEFGYDLNV